MQEMQQSQRRTGPPGAQPRNSQPALYSKSLEQHPSKNSTDGQPTYRAIQSSVMPRTHQKTNSTSSTSTTSLSYLRKAAEAVIASAHQTHFGMKTLHQQQQQQLHPTHVQAADSFNQLGALYDGHEEENSTSPTTKAKPEFRHPHYRQQRSACEPGIDDINTPTTPHQYLRHSQIKNYQFKHHPDKYSTYKDFYQNASRVTSMQTASEYNPDFYVQQRHSDDNRPVLSYQPSAWNQPNEQSDISELNPEQEIVVEGFNEGIENEAVMATGYLQTSFGQARNMGGQYIDDHYNDYEDREAKKVHSRYERGYNLSQDFHRDLLSSIRPSFLASHSNDNQINHANVWDRRSESATEDQPWLGYIEGPMGSDIDTRRQQHEEARDRLQERRLMDTIFQLEQEVADLHDANRELQGRLRDSEENQDYLAMEYDIQIRQIQNEHKASKEATKRRTKKFHDDVMKKRQRDEDKRLASMKEHIQKLQTSNKELFATIRAMQREQLETEMSQRDDFAVLNSFLEDEIIPTLHRSLATPEVVQDYQQDTRSRLELPSVQTTDGLWDKIHELNCTDKYTETLTTSATATDYPNPSVEHCSSNTVEQCPRSCTTPHGQKCLSLLEHLWTVVNPTLPKTSFSHYGYLTSSQEQVGNESLIWLRGRQKRHSDSSSISSGKTIVVPRSILSSKPICSIATASLLATATSDEHNDALTAFTSDNYKETLEYEDCETNRVVEFDQSIRQRLARLRAEQILDVERIKKECVRLYRESLDDIRTDMLEKVARKSIKNQATKSA
ncbi:hypothetical protein BGZ49_007636 [Haplosporangium sp. Z 27]|nr:hypothetical protein BGZ49_007636 [Haplosporangium sp. Z 27]